MLPAVSVVVNHPEWGHPGGNGDVPPPGDAGCGDPAGLVLLILPRGRQPPRAARGMTPKNDPERRVLLANRKARHEYEVLETIEAGIALVGSEVKSLRAGKANMGDAYAMIENAEAWLLSLHISPYTQAHQFNHDPMRRRKLLLHKAQINRLRTKIQEKGLTLVPLALVLVKNHVKVDLGLARGRKLHDKREASEKKDVKREVERALRDRERERGR